MEHRFRIKFMAGTIWFIDGHFIVRTLVRMVVNDRVLNFGVFPFRYKPNDPWDVQIHIPTDAKRISTKAIGYPFLPQ